MKDNLIVEINWIEDGNEWKGVTSTLSSILEEELDKTPDTSKAYYLVLDGDDYIYALISVPKDLPEYAITSPDGIDFMAEDYAMMEWGCTSSMYWCWTHEEWKYV